MCNFPVFWILETQNGMIILYPLSPGHRVGFVAGLLQVPPPLCLDAVTSAMANCREGRSHGFESRTSHSGDWFTALAWDIMSSLRPGFRIQ